MIVYPDIDPVAFALGPLKVRWYGLMYVIGIVLGWWLARRRAARPGSTWKPVDVGGVTLTPPPMRPLAAWFFSWWKRS